MLCHGPVRPLLPVADECSLLRHIFICTHVSSRWLAVVIDSTGLPVTLPRYIEAYSGTCQVGTCNAEDAEKTVKAVEDVVIASFGVHLDTKSQDIVRSLVRCWWNEVRQARQQAPLAWVAHTKHVDVVDLDATDSPPGSCSGTARHSSGDLLTCETVCAEQVVQMDGAVAIVKDAEPECADVGDMGTAQFSGVGTEADGEGQGLEHEVEAQASSNLNEATQQEAEKAPGGQGRAEDEAAVLAQNEMEKAVDADTGQFNGKPSDLQTTEKLQTKGLAATAQVEGAVAAPCNRLLALELKGKAQAVGERTDTAHPNGKACSPKGKRKVKSVKVEGQVKRPRNEGDEDPGRLEEEPDADREAEAEAEGKVQAVKVDEAQSNGERVVTWDEVVEAKDQRRSARAGAEEGAGRPKAQMEVHRAEANAHRADTESKGKAMTAKAGPETGAPCDEQDGDIKDVVQHQSKRRRRMLTVGVVLGGVLRVSAVKGSARWVKMHTCTSTLCSRPCST